MWRHDFIASFLLASLCITIFGCADEIPEPLTERDLKLSILPAKVISVNVEEGVNFPSDGTIIVKFNRKMSSVRIDISNAEGSTILSPDGMTATFTPSTDMPSGSHILTISGTDQSGIKIDPFTPINFYVNGGGSSSKITFSSNRDGDYEIYLMRDDGTGLIQLTFNFADDSQPCWSPDGSKIAFMSDRDDLWGMGMMDIYIMNADGTGQINLTNTFDISEVSPVWFYDGKRIGFYSEMDDLYYVINTDGTNVRMMSDDEWFDLDFMWESPSGMDIAIADNVSGNWEIYRGSFDGDTINLTNNPADDFWPSWSPDGKRIAFVSSRDFNNEIYIMNADGTKQTRLTSNPADDREPAWSPF